MQCVIDWCNANAGFIAAISAFFTIIISFMIGRMPYKKALEFNTMLNYDENGEFSLLVSLFNSGNSPLHIRWITVKTKSIPVALAEIDGDRFLPDVQVLAPQHMCHCEFTLENCNADEVDSYEELCIEVDTGTKKFTYKTDWGVG